ncbi:MAG: dTDP-4-dehydrorhamnose reductase [Pseudomonadota bacterium]
MANPFLIIGRSGQVATELQALLTHTNRPFDSVDRAQLDLTAVTSPSSITALIDHHHPCAVLNAAAYTAVDAAEDDADTAARVNAQAPGHMATACAAASIPFVHVSTDFVFDGKADVAYTEDVPCAPLGVYGQTKLDGELNVRESGAVHAILRTSWVFSAHGKNFVKTMLRLGNTHEKLTIVADQWGGPTPADAIASAMVSIADALIAAPEKSGLYHFAGAPATNWAGLARASLRAAGIPTPVEDITTAQYPTPAQRPAYSVLNCEKIKETFDIDTPDWEKSLVDIVEQLKHV